MKVYYFNSRNFPAVSLKQVLAFVVGTAFGFSFAYLWTAALRSQSTFLISSLGARSYSKALGNRNLLHIQKRSKNMRVQSPILYEVDDSIAQAISREVRVLCWIVTSPDNIAGARAVKGTWGKRCDILMFSSPKVDKDLPTITLNLTEDLPHLVWKKTKRGFTHIYNNYLDSADWFIKADDWNYVIMENLKQMLRSHSPDKPIYFGRKFQKEVVKQGYMSGGAGYVLSREAIRRFVEVGMKNPYKCRRNDGGQEDLELGICLENLGVVAGNSEDSSGRGKFFPFDPATHVLPGKMADITWYWQYANISYDKGIDCCSENTISFHYVFPDLMYLYDYFIYDLNSRKIK